MYEQLNGISPEGVWRHFSAISSIPRCSGNEAQARHYIEEIAMTYGYPYTVDAVGNIAVKKPPFPGMEGLPCIILQGHLDMVCEKNESTIHDFSRDPLKLVKNGDWLSADGTTLGADNGIAVAMALAVLEDKTLMHGPVEALFTVDEETGLTGALQLDPAIIGGKLLINLDTEEEGAFYIGCAGGLHTEAWIPVVLDKPHPDSKAWKLSVTGLRGGHSGADIHEGRGNAVRLAARILASRMEETDLRLYDLKGGGKHNAIPRECFFSFTITERGGLNGNSPDTAGKKTPADPRMWAEEFQKIFSGEFKDIEPGLLITVSRESNQPKQVFSAETSRKCLSALNSCPQGVEAMSNKIPGLVETSTNLAAVSLLKSDEIHILTSQRSNSITGRDDIAARVKSSFLSAGARVEQHSRYPAWNPDPDSPFLKKCLEIYRKTTGKEAAVRAIHAGLECGVIGDKIPGLQMISIGPDLTGVHTPGEKLNIPSVERVWNFLLELLKSV